MFPPSAGSLYPVYQRWYPLSSRNMYPLSRIASSQVSPPVPVNNGFPSYDLNFVSSSGKGSCCAVRSASLTDAGLLQLESAASRRTEEKLFALVFMFLRGSL